MMCTKSYKYANLISLSIDSPLVNNSKRHNYILVKLNVYLQYVSKLLGQIRGLLIKKKKKDFNEFILLIFLKIIFLND